MAKSQGVARVVFNNNGKTVLGTYRPTNKVIYLNNKQPKKEMLNTYFHELAHHVAVLQNKWTKYHLAESFSYLCKEYIFSVENKVDQIAEKLWYKYVDIKAWGRYKYAYPKAEKNQIIEKFISKLK
jgi:hypothetical protein